MNLKLTGIEMHLLSLTVVDHGRRGPDHPMRRGRRAEAVRRDISLWPGVTGHVREGREHVARIGTHGAGPKSWELTVLCGLGNGAAMWAPDADVPNPSRHVRAGTFVFIGRLPSRPGTAR